MIEINPHPYKVVVNRKGRYSCLPWKLKAPSGWEETGKCGPMDECLEFVRRLSGLEKPSAAAAAGYTGGTSDGAPPPGEPGTGARPLVSIIMPAYNREKLLPIAIQSILNQTYANWELLVVDDRSADGTKALIEGYSKRDGRIRYLANERGKGPSGARNFGILYANGAYIAFLDSDDEWLEHHLSASLDVLTNKNVKVTLATNYKRINGKLISHRDDRQDEELERAVMLLRPRVEGKLVFFGEDFFEYNLTERFCLYHINTMVLEKGVLDRVGAFNEAFLVNEDYDLMFRIFHDYGFCYINDYHFIYNYGEDNLYAFTDRKELFENEASFGDDALVKKLSFTVQKRIAGFTNRKELVRSSPRIKNADDCMKQLNDAIGRAYLTLGYINLRRHKLLAVKYLMKAMGMRRDKNAALLLGKTLFPPVFRRFYFDIREVQL